MANDQIRDKFSLAFADLGEQMMKNIARAIGVFGLAANDIAAKEFFADGLAEDVLTGLSRFRDLFVSLSELDLPLQGEGSRCARHRAGAGVHFVLKGSVRRAGDRVRVTVQLVGRVSRRPTKQ